MSTQRFYLCDRCGEKFAANPRPGTSSMPGDWAQLILVDLLDRPVQEQRFIRHIDICRECKRDLLDKWLVPA
jgi:hypothetical protein